MSIDKAQVESALAEITDENMETDLVAAGSVKEIQVDGTRVSVVIWLGYPASGYFDTIKQTVEDSLKAMDGIDEVTVSVSSKIKSHAVQQNLKPTARYKKHYRCSLGKGWRRKIDNSR